MLQYFEDEEYEQLVQDAQTFGMTEKNELWNGRYVKQHNIESYH